jgi:hypothetical protein
MKGRMRQDKGVMEDQENGKAGIRANGERQTGISERA